MSDIDRIWAEACAEPPAHELAFDHVAHRRSIAEEIRARWRRQERRTLFRAIGQPDEHVGLE